MYFNIKYLFMVTNIILKGERNKVCEKKIFLIFKILLTYFLPITKKNIPENFPLTEILYVHLIQCKTK